MFKKHVFGWLYKLNSINDRQYDGIGNVGDAAGKGSNLPADVDEREVLDRLDDDKKDDKDKGTKEPPDESEDEGKETEEDEENLDEDDNEGNEEEKEEEQEEDGLDLDDAEEETSIHQKLKKDYKEIYKKIPELRGVLFREQEFTKIYHTIDDAKEASNLANTFIEFQKDIESGNAKTLLEATRELGKDSLKEFSSNFLPALAELDKDTYLEVVSPEFKRLLRAALRSDNEDIRQSAKNLNYFLWQTTDVEKDEGFTSKKADPREDKISQREKEIETREFTRFQSETVGVAVSRAKKIISNSLKDFNLSNLTLNHLTDEIYKRTIKTLDGDVRYNGEITNKWKKAKADGYSTEGKESIINAFLSRAKVAIPKHRQAVLAESKVSGNQPEKKKDATRISGSNSLGKSGQPVGKVDAKKIDWNATSERDLLDGKPPVLRK